MKCFAEGKVFDWQLITIMLSVFFYFATPCAADIADDLKPIDGYVVKAGENGFVIDLDGGQGIAIGDVFSVIGPGEELVHPVTKKVIGKLEEVKGVLKVIRISEGFSYARPLGDSAAIKRGDQIRRFGSLKAVFWDYSDKNRPLFDRLQNTLPFLTWQDYQTSQLKRPPKPSPLADRYDALIFIVDNNMLEVRDAQFALIHKYSLKEAMAGGGVEVSSPVVGRSAEAQLKAAPVAAQPVNDTNKSSVITYGSVGAVAGLSDNILMADMLQQSGQRILAATDGKKISIFNVENQLKLLAEGKIGGYGEILAVKWWQPDVGGPLYLAVLAWTDDKIDSTLFILENDRLTAVVSGMDSILGSFDLDKDGRPETLLSQEFEADNFFGRRIGEMYWHESQLKQKKITLELPAKFTVIGGLLADLTGDGELEAAYVRNGTLWVYSGKKRLYVSQKRMGGSLSTLTYKVDPAVPNYRSTSVFFEVTPVAVDIDADGREELLVVSSDQSSIRAPGIMTTIDKSRIVIFNYENGTFVKGTVGEPVDAAIQGLSVDGQQVLFVATDTGSPFAQGTGSRLQTLDIAL
jgi:hypothetical protein